MKENQQTQERAYMQGVCFPFVKEFIYKGNFHLRDLSPVQGRGGLFTHITHIRPHERPHWPTLFTSLSHSSPHSWHLLPRSLFQPKMSRFLLLACQGLTYLWVSPCVSTMHMLINLFVFFLLTCGFYRAPSGDSRKATRKSQ